MIHAIIHYGNDMGETRVYATPMQFDNAFKAQQFVDEMNRNYPFIHAWQEVDLSVLTPEEAVTQLNAMVGGDPEGAHAEADRILCKVLRGADPKYAAVATAFDNARIRADFWYS